VLLTGDPVNLAQGQVLVFEGAVAAVAQLVLGAIVARTGTVLMNRPTMESAPTTSSGLPATTAPKATSR
jgi:hypothetical protein